jgi:hypothetical protein
VAGGGTRSTRNEKIVRLGFGGKTVKVTDRKWA